MSNLSLFLKKNKKQRPNVRYAATQSLCDEKGKPLEWEIKPISSAEHDRIREECGIGTEGSSFWGRYREKFLTACIVYPDLYDQELQDSYGVMSAEELLRAMVDDPKEFDALYSFAYGAGDTDGIEKRIEEAKN